MTCCTVRREGGGALPNNGQNSSQTFSPDSTSLLLELSVRSSCIINLHRENEFDILLRGLFIHSRQKIESKTEKTSRSDTRIHCWGWNIRCVITMFLLFFRLFALTCVEIKCARTHLWVFGWSSALLVALGGGAAAPVEQCVDVRRARTSPKRGVRAKANATLLIVTSIIRALNTDSLSGIVRTGFLLLTWRLACWRSLVGGSRATPQCFNNALSTHYCGRSSTFRCLWQCIWESDFWISDRTRGGSAAGCWEKCHKEKDKGEQQKAEFLSGESDIPQGEF